MIRILVVDDYVEFRQLFVAIALLGMLSAIVGAAFLALGAWPVPIWK